MGKEEQQQNLYQLLLQRNQFNYQVIRKYRKKSNNYNDKIILEQKIDSQCHEVGGTIQGGKAEINNKSREMEMKDQGQQSRKELKENEDNKCKQVKANKIEKQCQQKSKEQRIQYTIFPSISHLKGKEYSNSKNKSQKKSNSISSKINIIMSVSSTLGNLREFQKIKPMNALTENITNHQDNSIGNVLSFGNIRTNLNSVYIHSNGTHSCHHATQQQSLNNKNHSLDDGINKDIKTQTILCQSMKKQEKVNSKGNSQDSKDKDIQDAKENINIKDFNVNVGNQKETTTANNKQCNESQQEKADKNWTHNKHYRSKIKCKKYEQYYKQICNRSNIKENENISEARKHKWLTNITNLINNNNIDNGSVFSSCKNINIGFLHTITYGNKANYEIGNKSIINNTNNNKASICKRINNNKNNTKILQQSTNIISGISTTATTTKNSTKFPQMLPQIKKFKQFKYNFQRLIKKQCYHNNSITLNASNCSQTHNQLNNYSCIGNAILKSSLNQSANNNENYNCSTVLCTKGTPRKTGSGGTACTLFDSLSECSNRLFKIQSIPANYIKRI